MEAALTLILFPIIGFLGYKLIEIIYKANESSWIDRKPNIIDPISNWFEYDYESIQNKKCIEKAVKKYGEKARNPKSLIGLDNKEEDK